MYATQGAPERARWAVMWVYSSNGGARKVARKDFGSDLTGALALYSKAKAANKPATTLVCVNMGFPPPENLRPKTVKKRGRSKRTGQMKTVTVEINPLRELNMQGKLYCPYCRAIRPFQKRNSAWMDGIRIPHVRYVCPICGISHNDHWVRVYNPTASIHMQSSLESAKRRPRASRATARRNRRR